MRLRRGRAVATIAGFLAMAAAACGGAGAGSPASQYQDDPEALARGEALFKGVCGAYCHGLKPDHRDAPFLFDCTWKNGASDPEIFESISRGVGGTRMPPFESALSEEDRWKLVAFLRSRANCP